MHVSFTDAQQADHGKDSQSMFLHIISKCQPLNSAKFTLAVVDNWKAWLDKECQFWNQTSEFVANLCPFQWHWPLQSSQHPLSVTSCECRDIPKESQIVVYDSVSMASF